MEESAEFTAAVRARLIEQTVRVVQAGVVTEAAAAAVEAGHIDGPLRFEPPQHCIQIDNKGACWPLCQTLKHLPADFRIADFWLLRRGFTQVSDEVPDVLCRDKAPTLFSLDANEITNLVDYNIHAFCTYSLIHDGSSYVIYGSIFVDLKGCPHERTDVLIASSEADLELIETLVTLSAPAAPDAPLRFNVKIAEPFKVGNFKWNAVPV